MNPTATAAKTVLIVDDEKDLVETLTVLLQAKGPFRVESAYDGEAGVEKARTTRPDLLLVDLILPGMDGKEVCRRLQADPATKDIPIILMTALPPWRAESSVDGHTVLFKPFDAESLLGTLGRFFVGAR